MSKIYTITKCGTFRRVIRQPSVDFAAAFAKGWGPDTVTADEQHPAVAYAIAQPIMQQQIAAGHAQAEVNIPNWV